MTTVDQIRRDFDLAPMSRKQIGAVAITVALSAIDGYDVLSISFAAPAIAFDWSIGKAALAIVLSAGLAGMALGSLLLAPLADIFGRRPLVIVGLALMALGMGLSAFAPSVSILAGSRVITGLGIGAMVAVINPIAAEFANARQRPLAMALMAMGYPLGGLIGGLLASALLRVYTWHAIFVAGAIAAIMLVPIVLRFLPESLAFLLTRSGPRHLEKANRLLVGCGHQQLESLPLPAARRMNSYAEIVAPHQRGTTLRVTAANFFYVMTVYYVLSWMPQMVVELGFTPADASLVAAFANLVGIAGGLTLGMLARRAGLQRVTIVMAAGLGVSTAIFALLPPSIALLMVGGAVSGFFLFGGIAGIYATLAVSFPDASRASGSGFVIGVGRIGSALAPLISGWLFASGFGFRTVSLMFGVLAIIAGLCLALKAGAPSESSGSNSA